MYMCYIVHIHVYVCKCVVLYVHVCTCTGTCMYMCYIICTCVEFLSECSAREEGKFLISNLSSRQVKH